MNEVDHMRGEEDVNMGLFLQEMTTRLKALQGSRCSDFIVGFGGKDADLDEGGCTGIVEVVGVDVVEACRPDAVVGRDAHEVEAPFADDLEVLA